MNIILKEIKKPFLVALSLLLICGVVYPFLLTGISQVIFPKQANGSLITIDHKVVGSELVGQDFTSSYFMKCRPSAVNYNTYTKEEKKSGEYTGISSGSKNYAPTNPELSKRVREDLSEFIKANPFIKKEDIPTDLLTASGSGLDPHISPKAAAIQIPSLAIATGLSENRLKEIVKNNTQEKVVGIFGEETVNVLKVNLQIANDLNLVNETK